MNSQTPAFRLYSTVLWLRWRIFVNALRGGKGAVGELAAKLLSYPLLALLIVGPSTGAGFASYYLTSHDMHAYLALPLWGVFLMWHLIGITTSASGPSFDLELLLRFPIRYREYFLLRLCFGLIDPPTLAGFSCLAAIWIGITLADASLAFGAFPALFLYGLTLYLFARMAYLWLERWFAQRRTRELLTVVILIASLAVQFLAQSLEKFSASRHSSTGAVSSRLIRILVTLNWYFPAGAAARYIERLHQGRVGEGVLSLLLLPFYAAVFLAILHLRFKAQYQGENLHEAPSRVSTTVQGTRFEKSRKETNRLSEPNWRSMFPSPIMANLNKEMIYLLRSGPKLYVLILPVFIVVLISVRTAGLDYAGLGQQGARGMYFCYGCAYLQLLLVGMLYNSLGGDGSGTQFYFLAPVSFRYVMFSKNMLTFFIFLVEVVLVWLTSAFMSSRPAVDLTLATLMWSIFTLFVNMSIGNIRSMVSPKLMDPSKMRSQNVSGLNSLISLAVSICSVLAGVLVALLCRYLHTGYWLAAVIFGGLAAFAILAYVAGLKHIDSIAGRHIEKLTNVLGKV